MAFIIIHIVYSRTLYKVSVDREMYWLPAGRAIGYTRTYTVRLTLQFGTVQYSTVHGSGRIVDVNIRKSNIANRRGILIHYYIFIRFCYI